MTLTVSSDYVIPADADLVLEPGAPEHEWHAVRATGLGGSDVMAAMGGSRYLSPYGLWLIKTGRWSGPEQNAAMTRGKVLEDVVADMWSAETGLGAVRTGTWRRRDAEHELGNPDRFTSDGGILEVKTTASTDGNRLWRVHGIWTPTLSALAQVQWYMHITGARHAHLVLLPAGAELQRWVIPADPAMIEHMRAAARNMWDLITTDTPPPIDAAESTQDALHSAYQVGEPETAVADDRLPGLFAQLREARDAKKAAATAERDAANAIKAIMGTSQVATAADGVKVGTWNTAEQDAFQLDQFKHDHPELYHQYVARRSVRTLRAVKARRPDPTTEPDHEGI